MLVVGWLLGLLTAFVWPAVATERRSVMVTNSAGFGPNSPSGVAALTLEGWMVTRTDTLRDVPVVQLERARYLSVYEDLQDRPRGSWCWLTTGDWFC